MHGSRGVKSPVPDRTLRVLVVEDDPVDRQRTRRALAQSGWDVETRDAATLDEARRSIHKGRFDCVLLDLRLPDGDGLELIREIHDTAMDTAVVVVTGLDDEEAGSAALGLGAQDCVGKDEQETFLVRSVRNAVERQRVELELMHANARLEALANQDPLTGLHNRRGLEGVLRFEAARARHRGTSLAAVLVDLDDFKHVNDAFGHAVGDRVLERVGRLLRSGLRPADTAARIGGDEFLLLLPSAGAEEALEVAERIRAVVSDEPILAREGPVRITASMGVVDLSQGASGLEQILVLSREALKRSKEEGKNRVTHGRQVARSNDRSNAGKSFR